MALAVLLTVLWLLLRPDAPAPDIHDQIQQRLLEAEYGSARSFHFAVAPTAPVGNGEPLGEVTARLRASDPAQRWAAAGELAQRRDRRAVEAVIGAMLDAEDTLRVCVMATALGRIGDPRALGPLTRAAFDPGNRDLRLCAIQSLGMIGDRRAVPDLIRALEQRNMPVAAADALARLGDARALAPLLVAAEDPELRLWVLRALGELGQPGAEVALRSWTAADNPDQRVREAAVEALWKLERLSSTPAHTALAQTLQNDADPGHRAWAAFRLGEAHDPTGIPALTAALADPDSGIRERAAQLNPEAAICTADLAIEVADEEQLAGKRVLVIEDGPTVTHGGMAFGAGTVAAER
ncbi:MAG: HEAT repeat domain-containing protein, partial [Gammaproteobacteria bacterium]|nr:HEAT repeat domain-containing protein [Gammaproteobacteria bacterium]